MTLEEAITHLGESLNDPNRDWGCKECKDEHLQLRNWLQELKERREAGTIVSPLVLKSSWELLEGGSGRCLNCKRVLKDVWDYDRSDPYCRECGADMRGVDKASATSVHTISLWLKKHKPSNWGSDQKEAMDEEQTC